MQYKLFGTLTPEPEQVALADSSEFARPYQVSTNSSQSLLFRLTGTNDITGLGNSTTIIVNVLTEEDVNSGNAIPQVSTSQDISVEEGETVSLVVDSDRDQYQAFWLQNSGPRVNVEIADSNTSTFVAPEVDEVTTLEFEVVVEAENGLMNKASTSVTVSPKEDENTGTSPNPSPSPGGSSSSGSFGPFALLMMGIVAILRRRRV